ncbi:hypothetical protein NC651_027762 [Populus alba x Populus x berolinensis]|nr:hypothetical protein NC651_027762 [Populus alba x Populus x berolinensis]
MMQDLSFLSEKPTTSTSTNSTASTQPDYMFSGYKRKRGFKDTPTSNSSDKEFVLRSPNKNKYIFDDKTKCEKFVEVLDSFSCLTNPHSRTCAFVLLSGVAEKNYAGFCLLEYFHCISSNAEARNYLGFIEGGPKESLKSGLKAVFVIINSETKDKDEIGEPSRKVKNSLSLSTIFNTMKKQESAFKTNLWEAAKFLLCKIGNRVAMPFSLEDLLNFVRKDGISVSKSEAKQAKGCHTLASSSYSFQDTMPLEMVEHLREGIGSKGQALAHDQLRVLAKMIKGFDTSINIGIYDGDTALKDRLLLLDHKSRYVTLSILPYHRQFNRILSNLRFVVIDEAHYYKVYGSDPSFVFSTATSANPCEHCMELANLSTLELIKNDGSPSSRKLFVLWNPTSCPRIVPNKSEGLMDVSESTEKSMSPISDVSYLFGRNGSAWTSLHCLLQISCEILQKTAPHLVGSICAYRAGYVVEDRRQIERDFFSGKLSGIAATNALELGIDVGHIDATLHLGFPGSFAVCGSKLGRSGRRERPSRAVLKQHLVCAALEHPLSLLHDEKYFGSSLSDVLMSLKNKGDLSFDPSRDSFARIWSYIGHECFNISRNNAFTWKSSIFEDTIESTRYRVIDMISEMKSLKRIEESKAFLPVCGLYAPREGAYMRQGIGYIRKRLLCAMKPTCNYYTKTRDYTGSLMSLEVILAYPAKRRSQDNQFFKNSSFKHFLVTVTTTSGFGSFGFPVPQSIKNLRRGETIFSFRAEFCMLLHMLFSHIQPYFTEMLNAALELLTCCHCSGGHWLPKLLTVAERYYSGKIV